MVIIQGLMSYTINCFNQPTEGGGPGGRPEKMSAIIKSLHISDREIIDLKKCIECELFR